MGGDGDEWGGGMGAGMGRFSLVPFPPDPTHFPPSMFVVNFGESLLGQNQTKSENYVIEFEQNRGSGAFRSSRITRGALCYIDSCEYQPIFPHGRPNHEELISKTSPKPNFRVWDSSLMYRILILYIGF